MTYAIVVSLFAVLFAYLVKSSNFKYGLELAFLLVTGFLSLGYNWGNDVPTYELWFDDFKGSSMEYAFVSSLTHRAEIGWIYLNILCGPIGFYGMRFVLFAFENFVIYRLIKKHVDKDYYWLAVFVYCFNPYFMVLSSSMMRQWLSMCIIILVVELSIKRKWLYVVPLCVFAYLFHKTAIVCLPIVIAFFLNSKDFIGTTGGKRMMWLIPFILLYLFVAPNLFSGTLQYLLSDELMDYASYSDRQITQLLGPSTILISSLYLYMLVKTRTMDKEERIHFYISSLYIFAIPLQTFSELASRLSLYFTVFSIVCYPMFLKNAVIEIGKRQVITLFIILFYIYQYYLFFTSPIYSGSYSNYQTLYSVGIL